jgi:hypothetical protein
MATVPRNLLFKISSGSYSKIRHVQHNISMEQKRLPRAIKANKQIVDLCSAKCKEKWFCRNVVKYKLYILPFTGRYPFLG